ncbi:MAG TPA: signal peptidase I [Ignavibacteriaceae bacterium]|jgi:signal peptidase I
MSKEKFRLNKTLKTILLVLLIALLIKAFLFDAFSIPSSSMERTLLPGDFIIAGRAAFKISTPKELPLVNIKIPYVDLIELGDPDVNDVIVFDFPGNEIIPEAKYIKRIIAGPGDSLRIFKNKISINGIGVELPSTMKFSNEEKNISEPDTNIFPPGVKWNRNNYGPIVIPKKGDIIAINPNNYSKWKYLVEMDDPENILREEGSVVSLNGWPITEYVVTKNYYFVIGDNFDESKDSRYFGFINEDMIIGKALFIYWSIDDDKIAPGPLGFLSALRTNRILSGVD